MLPSTSSKPTGSLIDAKGVYLGAWEPQIAGQKLGKVFDVYAAPHDLKHQSPLCEHNLLLTYNMAVTHVAGLTDFHGHNGTKLLSERAVLDAVRDNPTILENWFIPTLELLSGHTNTYSKTRPANLFSSRNKGAFKNTFVTKYDPNNANWYWSCTEPKGSLSHVYNTSFAASFASGANDMEYKNEHGMSLRVIRAELKI